jgi:hypothetical protein
VNRSKRLAECALGGFRMPFELAGNRVPVYRNLHIEVMAAKKAYNVE